VLLVPLVLAGSACGGAASAQADPSAQQAGSPPACKAPELRGLFRGFRPAGGSLTAAVVLTSAGARPCSLDGTPPSVTLLDQSGGSVSVRSHAVGVPENAGAVDLTPGVAMPGFGAAPPSGSAWFVVTWSNWCSDALPAVSSLLVLLPGGGSIVAQPDATAPSWAAGPSAPRCDDARAGSTVTIGRFQSPASQARAS
jgi:Protein of unknown function (DUF4232)